MRIEEERYGVARPFGNIDYAMRRRQKSVVSPALQDVAAVDHVGVLDDGSVNPLSIWQTDRESWHVIRCQNRHEAAIGMGRDAELIFCALRARGIMCQPLDKRGLLKHRIEEIGRKVESDS